MIYRDPGKIKFTAPLKVFGPGACVEFPYSVEELFGVKGRVPVSVIFDGKVHYQGSLVRMERECHLIGVRKEIRDALGKKAGDTVDVELMLDNSKRTATLPKDVEVLLKKEGLLNVYKKTAFTHQREYAESIVDAKKPETREKRIQLLIEFLKKKST